MFILRQWVKVPRTGRTQSTRQRVRTPGPAVVAVAVVAIALVVAAVLFGVVLSASPAFAAHCTGDQAHLSNDECGYWVEVVPDPSPTPRDVKVVNASPLDVAFPGPMPVTIPTPVPVVEQNPAEGPTGTATDAKLEELRAEAWRGNNNQVLAAGLALFVLVGILLMVVPRARS